MNVNDQIAEMARTLGAKRRAQGITSGLAVERAVMEWLCQSENGPGLATDSACIIVEAHVGRLNDKATPAQIGARMLVDFDADVFAAYVKDTAIIPVVNLPDAFVEGGAGAFGDDDE